MIKKPRGTSDILPDSIYKWQYVEKTVKETAENFGFKEIRFPTFEATELFLRGVGDTTDIVQKEMYTFEDKEGRSFTLRPEGTASTVRALVENGLYGGTMPLKYYYVTNCFRYEKPQAGRSREFTQFGVEVFGADSPLCDAQIIYLASTVFKKLGINGIKLFINSIGCPECRKNYHKALRDYFSSKEDELCDTCKGRLVTNPMRILDCKSPICKEIAAPAPKTVDYLCDDCKNHFESLKKYLQTMGVEYTVDPTIVRGLDYYTKTVFEFVYEGIGAQATVCGGGRYDGLCKMLDGPELSGIGFAMGMSRLLLALETENAPVPEQKHPDIYIANLGEKATAFATKLFAELQSCDISAEIDTVGRSMKAQMKYADKLDVSYVLVIGDNEVDEDKATLKNMQGGESVQIKLSQACEEIVKIIGGDING